MSKPRWIAQGTRWLRGLIGKDAAPAAPWPGEEQLVLGRDGVRALEERLCGTVVTATDPTVVAGLGGMAMAGRRAAGLTTGADLAAAGDVLQEAAHRRAPFVLHATTSTPEDHEGLQAVADSGILVAVARDLQHLVDLTLVARRVAELGLVPVVVAMDAVGSEATLGTVRLPPPELVERYLGTPEDSIACPTPAQVLLFGNHRRRLPQWFDPDRPAGHGFEPDAEHTAAALAGRNVFFGEPLGALVRESMRELADLTGREGALVGVHRPKGARHVLVVQGALFALARNTAEHVRRREKLDVGVVAVDWTRPFPEQELRDALAGARTATVLEGIADPPGAQPPLLQAVRAACGADGPRLQHASFTASAPVAASDLARLFRRATDEVDAGRGIHLGVREPGGSTEFPKRQVLLQTIHRHFPDLGGGSPDTEGTIDLRPSGAKTVAMIAGAADPGEALLQLGEALEGTGGSTLLGHARKLGHEVVDARVTVASAPFADPGEELPLDALLVEEGVIPSAARALRHLQPGRVVAIGSARKPEALWAAIPAAWRETIQRGDLRLLAVSGGRSALAAAAAGILDDENEQRGDTREVAWRDFPAVDSEPDVPEPPMAARRFARGDAAYDSVPRAWGELVEPMQAGEPVACVPDPRSAVGAVPPSTAGLFDVGRGRPELPDIDPDACVGCGRCWAACPDTALAPVALSVEAMLDAAAERAPTDKRDPAAAKLQRAHRQLATRIEGQLAKGGETTLTEDLLRDGYAWLVDKMKVGDDERPAMDTVFEATLSELGRAPLAATEHLFHAPHRRDKGTGSLLLLAVDPHTCQGCGICAAECPADAIEMGLRSSDRVAEGRRELQIWESLPDTPGSTIARAAEDPEVGALPAVLLSRHCLMSVVGGDGAEPGSGQRVATRQVIAVVEHAMQRRLSAHLGYVDDLAGRLRDAIRRSVSEAMPVDDTQVLDRALDEVPDRASNASILLSRLEELGERDHVDVRRLRKLLRVSQQVDRIRWRLAEGERGMGRSRFGVVVAGRDVAEWAARYPRNPFGAPVTVDTSGGGAALASGIALGLLERRTDEARVLRWAEALLEAPADLPAREEELAGLGWHDLTDEELALSPPVVLLATPDAFQSHGSTGLEHLLTGRLPVKTLVLDPHDLDGSIVQPSVFALVHRRSFVLASSIAHAEHLFAGADAAVGFPGPALLHLHAPSPAHHGFPSSETIARARLAVDSRVHPLLQYDPRREGVFGSRIDLDHNPAVDRPWSADDAGEWTPARWAAAEARFQDPEAQRALPGWQKDRAELWTMLQELAGVVTPFTQTVREAAEREVAEAHAAEVEALRADYERRMAELQQSQVTDQATRLRQRLLQLAGYTNQPTDSPSGDGGST